MNDRIKLMIKNIDKFSNNLITTAASNFANKLITDHKLTPDMKDHLVKMFIQGANWRMIQDKKNQSGEN